MAAKREMKTAIQMGQLGNLAALAASIPDGDKSSHTIGYIIGKAKGLSYRANPNGDEPSIGITGLFEATPTQGDMPIMVAPLCYFPKAFCEALAEVLQGDQQAPKKAPAKGKAINIDAGIEVPIAVEIGLRKNNGAGVGYEFSVVELAPTDQAQDALADMRVHLPAQIARTNAPALPAPVKAAKKKTGRAKKK